jgi:hypothetical protein
MPTEWRPLRPLALLFVLAAAAVVGACVAAPGAVPRDTAHAAAAADAAAAEAAGAAPLVADVGAAAAATDDAAKVRAAIDAADLAEPATIDAVDAVRYLDGASAAAAAAIKARVTGDALWAATWVYATVGTDPKVLRPVLATTDRSTRAIAAATALSLGDAAGAAPLVGLLRDESILSGSIPPEPVADYAAGNLARFIAGPKLSSTATRAQVASAWKAWLAKNGKTMRFSRTTGRWSVR